MVLGGVKEECELLLDADRLVMLKHAKKDSDREYLLPQHTTHWAKKKYTNSNQDWKKDNENKCDKVCNFMKNKNAM